jgi:hypothetical protein
MKNCPHCHRPLVEIDHYGERLIGCINCNRWTWPGSDKPFMALPEDDLEALSNLSNARQSKTPRPKSGSTEQ